METKPYLTNGPVLHQGSHRPAGSIIDLTDKQARRLGETVTLATKQAISDAEKAAREVEGSEHQRAQALAEARALVAADDERSAVAHEKAVEKAAKEAAKMQSAASSSTSGTAVSGSASATTKSGEGQ